MFDLVLVVVFLVVFIGGAIWAYRREKREWNNGICADNGLPWERFDTDSQGGRGYKAGEFTIWVSYPGIEKSNLVYPPKPEEPDGRKLRL